MRLTKNVFLALLIGWLGVVLGSCSKSEDAKGPMEKAGKSVDDTMAKARERAGQAIEKAGETIKETGEKMRESVERARDE
jgi:F0F1-type ATP synthase membrane subunit b/b'